MDSDKNKEILDMLIKKIQTMEKDIEEMKKKQQLIQDAFYRLYEEQRRRERKF
jgi:hypothetical protein